MLEPDIEIEPIGPDLAGSRTFLVGTWAVVLFARFFKIDPDS